MTDTFTAPSPSATEALLLDLEAQRCDAMKRADFARLREILHPALTHVHAKGQIDDYESYFRSGGTHVDYRQIDRSELKVRVLGGTALMTGRQLLVAVRKDGSGTVRIDSRVMQVWTQDEGRWRQLAFQTTPLEMSVT
ncbi:nuclear transport factor 2 family protein [Variovorax paradoxus]|uniref:nuclear transport factor 2 family protein n=1 Tax=Variovorax paradoxus TaxID=34073 RepID=UPI001EBDEA68|nr:nuclear transport factor 2 family protein [Burkholderiales bacterium]WPH16401.1 nuclear transport factor 2 family protein [Variovorax paradoxus]